MPQLRALSYPLAAMIATREPGSTALGEGGLSGPDTVVVAGPRVLSSHLDSIAGRVSRDFNYITFDHRFDRAEESFFYPRTNNAPYLERGIPVVGFFTGLHGDYHRQTDEPENLDPRKMEAVTRAAFATLWLLADDPIRPRLDRPWPANVPLIR
jgi:Zn-dependent M28 family amino/carboxypeptidase